MKKVNTTSNLSKREKILRKPFSLRNNLSTYHWRFTQMPDGSNASIVDADQPLASFTPDVSGNYVLELEVDDGATDGTSLNVDRIIIRVSDENVPPNADAGENQSLESCTRVTLDGS